jgi:hypothetical protein
MQLIENKVHSHLILWPYMDFAAVVFIPRLRHLLPLRDIPGLQIRETIEALLVIARLPVRIGEFLVQRQP